MTTYHYDGHDRLLWIQYPGDTNEIFGYDAASNITSYTVRDGSTINYEFDAINRLTVKNRPGDPNIVYRYNIASRLYDVNDGRAVTEGGGLTELYYYDRIGRLTDVNDIKARFVSYEYDERSLRTKLTYPDDSNVTYEYDVLGRLTKLKYENNTIAQYKYDELSRRTLLTLGNDANTVYEYDLANRLTKLTNNLDVSNSIIFEYADYDKVGNRLTCKVDDDDAQVYYYDVLYQLTYVDYNDGNTTDYDYDALGNRTEVDDGTAIIYDSNSLNQYTAVGPQGSQTDYHYDENGNLIDDGTYLYYYDCENRLTDVNDQNDTAVAFYKYDYRGRRVRKRMYGGSPPLTRYCYDGDQVIVKYSGPSSNIPRRKFIYGSGIDEPIAMIDCTDNDKIYYYHFDGLGSVVALSDVNATVIESYSYDVFGKVTIRDANDQILTTSSVKNPYMFTGRRYDEDTGLYYYRARYYKPDIGRFLQTDPIGYASGLNMYTYVGNNPVNYTDPYGLFRFGIKNIDGSIIPFSRYFFNGLIPNALNIGSYHQAGFYEDRTGDYADYGTNGLQDLDDYDFSPWQYDDYLMRQAQKNVDASGNFTPEKYRLFCNNCQSYSSALEKEYKRLGGKVKFRPFRNPEDMKKKSKKGS